MVSSLKTGRNWRDPVEKSVRTGRDDREAEAEDRMEQKKGRTVHPKTQQAKENKTQTQTQTRPGEGVCDRHTVTQSHKETHRPDQTRPDQTQTRPDQTRPDQTRPGQARPGQARPGQARPGQARPDETRRDETERERARHGQRDR